MYNVPILYRLANLSSSSDGSPSSAGLKMYDWVAWFARFQWFSYLGMGFQLLSIELTMKFWHSIYYIGHLVLPIFCIIGLTIFKPFLNMFLPKPPTDTITVRYTFEKVKNN